MSTWSVIPTPAERTKHSRYCDSSAQFTTWAGVAAGDEVLIEGRMDYVEQAGYQGLDRAIDTPDGMRHTFPPDDLTAVRRCSCRTPRGAAA